MIDKIIKEINICLDSECYIAALTLALTLPDICGKAKYPKMERHTKKRYIKWFDEYVGQYETTKKDIEIGMPYLSGELVYDLRCSVLHQGNPNVSKKSNLSYFELLYQDKNRSSVSISTSEKQTHFDADGNEIVIKKFSVNLRDMCEKICDAVQKYYGDNKELFNFFNYNFVDSDYRTRKIMGIKEGNII